jgi:hypothetical protein
MGVITWNLDRLALDKDTNIIVTVSELDDDILTGRAYTASMDKRTDNVKIELLKELKQQILADRAKTSYEDTIKATVDLSGFEDFINS